MAKVFHSPPNWPAPPPGWTPEPGWTPDPRWGAAPEGWQFWRDETPSTADDSAPTPRTRTRSNASTGDGDLRVFISYRRADSRAHVNGLYDGLATRLPDASIFMDLDSIPAGVDFEQHIREEINRCDVVLVVIGDEWLDTDPATGARRLDDPDDFVRLEIENALENPTVVVIPVLVEGARMPASTDLPTPIARLARINALQLDDSRWRSDLARLVDRVTEIGSRHKAELTTRRVVARPPREPEPTTAANPVVPAPTPTPPAPTYPAPDVGTPAPTPVSWSGASAPEPVRSFAASSAPPVSSFAAVSGFPTAAPRPMSTLQVLLSILMCALPVVSFSMLAWATPVLAASQRVGPGNARALLRIAAGGLAGISLIGFLLAGGAPEDAQGNAIGWQVTAGGFFVLAAMIAGVVIAIVYWKPRPGSPPTLRR